jgi:hypothetical protein
MIRECWVCAQPHWSGRKLQGAIVDPSGPCCHREIELLEWEAQLNRILVIDRKPVAKATAAA